MHGIKRKTIFIITGILVFLLCFVLFAFSRIVPSHAIDRPAIETEYGNIVNIDGFNLWYDLLNYESDNVPIIVIAGGSGLSSDYMEDSLTFLAETHPLLFYDARGCGRSQIKVDLSNYSVDQLSEELKLLKERFFPSEKVIILAHSFGGIIAMDYVANNSESVERMILVSSANPDYKVHYTDAYFRVGLPPHDQEKANSWYMEHIDAFLGRYFAVEEAKTIFDNAVTSYAVSAHIAGKSFDITNRVKNNNFPVLILVGGEKEYPLTDISTAQELSMLFTNSELRSIPESGHFMFAEKKEEFKKYITEWLE